MPRIVLTTILALAITNISHAAETGNSLRQKAISSNSYEQGFFLGYVVAVIESNVLKVCVPNEVTLGQSALVVKKYMEDHPEDLHRWADEVVLKAVNKAWPCKK